MSVLRGVSAFVFPAGAWAGIWLASPTVFGMLAGIGAGLLLLHLILGESA